MSINDITREAVLAACNQFDELGKTDFLNKFGFKAARTYEISLNGQLYDSKAILGAAHGFLGAGYSPLSAKNFSGGLQETVRVLEKLGFQVIENSPKIRNPNWTRDELILATEFYIRHAPSIPGKTTKALVDLADEIRAVAALLGLQGNETFRNPNGVYMKLMELRKYDDAYKGVGLGHERLRDVELEVWTLPETELLFEAHSIRKRIRKFIDEGGAIQKVARPLPKSKVVQDLLGSDDPLENQLAEALIDWQETKRKDGRFAGLGREPVQIRQHGAKYVVEQRVRSKASGFDEVSSSGQSYEKIVLDHAERFPADVVQIAKERMAEFDLVKPTGDREDLDRRTRVILDRPDIVGQFPAGNPNPRKEVTTGTVFVRDPRVVAYVQVRSAGKCELCSEDAPFRRTDGTPYLETHHILPLADGGPDTVENCAAVCPNCHRALHSSADREELAARLKTAVTN